MAVHEGPERGGLVRYSTAARGCTSQHCVFSSRTELQTELRTRLNFIRHATDSDATAETMLARVWAAENEREAAAELIGEYDAAGENADGAAKAELAEEREGLETTRLGVEASSAAAQQLLRQGGYEELLTQMFVMMREMNSDLDAVKKDVRKGNTTLSSLAVDELYCPRLVFITPHVPPGQQQQLPISRGAPASPAKRQAGGLPRLRRRRVQRASADDPKLARRPCPVTLPRWAGPPVAVGVVLLDGGRQCAEQPKALPWARARALL